MITGEWLWFSGQTALRNLLDSLLGLQQLVLLKNKDTSLVLDETAAAERDGSPTSVPEISSGDESDGAMDVGEAQADGVGSTESEPSVTSRTRRKRRKHRGWVGCVLYDYSLIIVLVLMV